MENLPKLLFRAKKPLKSGFWAFKKTDPRKMGKMGKMPRRQF